MVPHRTQLLDTIDRLNRIETAKHPENPVYPVQFLAIKPKPASLRWPVKVKSVGVAPLVQRSLRQALRQAQDVLRAGLAVGQ